MRYDLSRLGADEFEDLCQTLALRILGPGVEVFGEGPDGGREAAFQGRVEYPGPVIWEGYGVLQAKYRTALTTTQADTAWLRTQIRDELDEWADPSSSRTRLGSRPEYLIFASNVPLSGVAGKGGIDAIRAFIGQESDRLGLGLKDWDVWHSERICRYLDMYPEIRQTYGAYLTPGDVLARLQDLLVGSPDHGPVFGGHTAKEMIDGQWVRLGQAGDSDNSKLLLGSVAVDLPATMPSAAEAPFEVAGVAADLIAAGNKSCRPTRAREDPRHTVLVGGPGQGKTTITDLVCQVYRVALLKDRPASSIGPEAGEIHRRLVAEFEAIGLPEPDCRRWPVKITLGEYGDAVAGKEVGLLQYVEDRIAQRSPIRPGQLRSWLAKWPWLLVLDGLDEVSAPSIRERIMSNISAFLIDAAQADADLMIVATTRPQGYGYEFSSAHYRHLSLRPLTTAEALRYSGRLADVRHYQDSELRTKVTARLRAAADEPVSARLMRTPLQVTIMSLLLERRARPPQDRHGLFEAYYTTLYDREVNKATPTSQLLDEQRRNVHYLHERIGLLLQIRAEREGDADTAMPLRELNELTVRRLVQEGYDQAEADHLADRLVKASTDRLVQLVPRGVGTIGFEIRSLQELMAARAITNGADEDILARLRQLAPSTHWRNTWLFAASRLFTQREHLRHAIVNLLTDLDTASPLEMLITPGAQLAVEMLDEDVAAKAPLFRRLLTLRALALLEFLYVRDGRLAGILFDATSDSATRGLIERAIEQALAAHGPATLNAIALLSDWWSRLGDVAASARRRLPSAVAGLSTDLAKARSKLSEGPIADPAAALGVQLDAMPNLTFGQRRTTLSALSLLNNGHFDEVTPLMGADIQAILVDLVHGLPTQEMLAAERLRYALARWYESRPVDASNLWQDLA